MINKQKGTETMNEELTQRAAGLRASLDVFFHIMNDMEQDLGPAAGKSVDEIEDEETKASLGALLIFKVVHSAAELYYGHLIAATQETGNGNGSSGVNDEGEGRQGSGASVPEAGPERSTDQAAEGAEPTGVGGAGGDRAEHDSGDRDGSNEDTRE